MLVQGRIFFHRRDVQAALVGKGADAHVGGKGGGRLVGLFADEAGGVGEPPQMVIGQAAVAHLELQGGRDGGQVGVAAALAHAPGGALHLARARLHGGQGVGRGQVAVVVAVDAQGDPGQGGGHLAHALGYPGGQGAAVGVAEHQGLGPGLGGGGEHRQGVGLVLGQAVEEVLRVKEHPASGGLHVGHRRRDDLQVALQLDAQLGGHVLGPGLAHQGAHRGRGGDEGGQVGVVLRGALGVMGGTKGHQDGGAQLELAGPFEKFLIAGVGAGPAPLDVAHPQAVQLAGHLELVLGGEYESFGLGSVPEGGVVEFDYRGVTRHI